MSAFVANNHVSASSHFVKVSLQEMHLFAILQQPGPEFLLQLLLPQHELHLGASMICLAVLDIDLAVELQFDVVFGFFGGGDAGEG